MKTCSKCKIEKDLSDFYKKKSSKDGHRSECKECDYHSTKIHKQNYYNKNKDILKSNLDKDKFKLYMDDYRKSNKESIRETNKIYRENNKENLNSHRKEYRKNKFLCDPIYKLQHNIRSNISNSFKGYSKNSKTQEILGCEFSVFKKYIEDQFKENMSWENFGEWHLDHKTPISWAETEERVYELNHYTNFQPLWAKDNLIKGNKWSD
jgi:hypothetical protein